jgi:hypothetical protein
MFPYFYSLQTGEWIGVAGIFVSLAGFGIAIYQVRKTGNAAQAAKTASEQALAGVSRIDTLMEFASVNQCLGQLKTALRNGQHEALPALFDQLQRSLSLSANGGAIVDTKEIEIIEKAKKFFATLEVQILDNSTDEIPIDRAATSAQLIEINDALYAIQNKNRAITGRKNAE